jgi:hypothetical protein
VAGRLTALKRERTRLVSKITAGTEKLALLPPDLLPDMVEQVRLWKSKRDTLDVAIADAERDALAVQEADSQVERAMENFARLSQVVHTEDPLLVRDMLHGLLEKVELTFNHVDLGPKRRRSICTSATVHFRPMDDLLAPMAVCLESSQEDGRLPR